MTDSPRKLTREDILVGKNKVEDVFFEDLEGVISLRPLSDSEYLHSQAIVLKAMRAEGSLEELKKAAAEAKKKGSKGGNPFKSMNVQVDMGTITEAEFEQSVYIVSCGMVDPKLTIDEVRQMRPIGIVKKVSRRILEMAGSSSDMENQIDNFRKE